MIKKPCLWGLKEVEFIEDEWLTLLLFLFEFWKMMSHYQWLIPPIFSWNSSYLPSQEIFYFWILLKYIFQVLQIGSIIFEIKYRNTFFTEQHFKWSVCF